VRLNPSHTYPGCLAWFYETFSALLRNPVGTYEQEREGKQKIVWVWTGVKESNLFVWGEFFNLFIIFGEGGTCRIYILYKDIFENQEIQTFEKIFKKLIQKMPPTLQPRLRCSSLST